MTFPALRTVRQEEQMADEPNAAEETLVPSSDDLIGQALGGMDVKSFLSGGDEPAPAPTIQEADPAERDQKIDELRQQVESLRANATQQHANWNAAHMAKLQADANVQAIQQARQQETNIAQAAAQMAPPQVNIDWAELYDDPEKLGAAVTGMVQQYSEWARNNSLGYVQPYIQQYQQAMQTIQPLIASNVESLLDRAKGMVEEKLGSEASVDFDDYRDKIKAGYQQHGASGYQVMSDPMNIVHAFNILAMEDGKQKTWKPPSDTPQPIHAGGAPSAFGRQGPDDATPAELLPIWREMSGVFGDSVKPPTAKDLRDAGIEW